MWVPDSDLCTPESPMGCFRVCSTTNSDVHPTKRKHEDSEGIQCTQCSQLTDNARMPAPPDSPPQAQRFPIHGPMSRKAQHRARRISQLLGSSPIKDMLTSPGCLSCASGASTPTINQSDEDAAMQRHAESFGTALVSADLMKRFIADAHMSAGEEDGCRTPSPPRRRNKGCSDSDGWEDSATTGFQPPELCYAPARKKNMARMRTDPPANRHPTALQTQSLLRMQAVLSAEAEETGHLES